ncbi:unnamed protein product, partial [Brassica oleracea]
MEYRPISPSRRSCNLLQVNASNSSRTPPIAPLRDPITTPPALDRGEVNSHSSGRRSAKERLELPPHTGAQPVNLSADRRSALKRIELPPSQDPARYGGLSNSMIARLQDVEVRYEDGNSQNPEMLEEDNERIPAIQRLELQDIPIQQEKEDEPLPVLIPAPRQAPKRKASTRGATSQGSRSRVNISPLHGSSFKKQLATRTSSTARKRLCVDKG